MPRPAITTAGRAFLPAARTTLRAAQDAKAAVGSVEGELRGELTVGVMQGLYPGLSRALAAFHHAHPRVAVRLRQASAEQLREALRDATVDLAVVALDRVRHRGLVTHVLAREEMVLIAAPASMLIPDGPVTVPSLISVPMVDFSEGWADRRAVDRAFRAFDAARPITFEVNDLLAATDLVRPDLAAAILPDSPAARFPELAVRRFTGPAPTWTVMLARPMGEAPPVVDAFTEHLS